MSTEPAASVAVTHTTTPRPGEIAVLTALEWLVRRELESALDKGVHSSETSLANSTALARTIDTGGALITQLHLARLQFGQPA